MWFTGTAVPVAGIVVVAFDPMQIGVHPRARIIILSLSKPVRLMPIALCLVPQRLQCTLEIFGWSVVIY